jgi:hypothetical protein
VAGLLQMKSSRCCYNFAMLSFKQQDAQRSSNALTCAPTAAGVTASSSAARLKLPRRVADSKALRLSKGGSLLNMLV